MIKKRIMNKYDELLHLTSIDTLEKSIRRFKCKTENIGKTPKNLAELHTCLEKEEWKKLLKVNDTDSLHVDFVILQSKTEAVIFIDKLLKDEIDDSSSDTIFVDRTFATVPKMEDRNCQLWTILIRKTKRTFPVAYAIMKGRTTKNYVDVLTKVANVLKLQPKVAISDFEKAAQKALQIVFPGIKLVGCFFHYSQALLDNAKKHHILHRNKNDNELEWGFIKLLTALALLPADLIEMGFDLITSIIFNIEEDQKLKTFANYYKQTWLQGYKPDLFSVHRRSNRTNNISERHNRELKETLKEHSTILTFLRSLTEHQKKIRSFISNEKFWTRADPKKSKEKETDLNNIWNTIEEEGEDVDLLLILFKLSNIIGKK